MSDPDAQLTTCQQGKERALRGSHACRDCIEGHGPAIGAAALQVIDYWSLLADVGFVRIREAGQEVVVEHIRADSWNRAFSLDAIEQVADQKHVSHMAAVYYNHAIIFDVGS